MIRLSIFTVLTLTTSVLLSACLQTRDDQQEQKQTQVLQKQVYTQQTAIADTRQRFEQIDDDTRSLGGKIETVENRVSVVGNRLDKSQQAQAQKNKELEDRMKTLQDAISKLDTDVAVINQQISVLAEAQKQQASAAVSSGGSSAKKEDAKSLFDAATVLYEKKKWKDAALEFERYRKASPKAKNIGEATYRIGVCFQEMGSNDDAQAFYEEVVTRFPKSSEARRANIRLKALKKK